jgi:hypothetical protein
VPWRRGKYKWPFHWQLGLDETLRKIDALHDEAHLEPLSLQFVLSRRVSLDLVMEAGGDDPCTHGQFASFDLFQAAAPEQACHLVALLLLPNRRQSLVCASPRRCSSFRAQSGRSMTNRGAPCSLLRQSCLPAAPIWPSLPSYLQVLVTKRILVEILLLRC